MMRASFLILAILAAGCTSPGSVTRTLAPPYPEGDEEVFAQRQQQYRSSVGAQGRLGGYDPVEPVIGAAIPHPIATAVAPALSDAALDEAETYAAARRSSSFLVWMNGALQRERYFGDADSSTPIVSKALAKPLATIVIGRAIQLGMIQSVDEPAANYITEWRDDPVRSRITIRHLLEMRSGLLAQSFGPDAPSILERAYLHPRHDSVMVYEYPVTDQPGERFEYSNVTTDLIALVIERATGRRYADFLGGELLQRIGAAGGHVWVNRPGGLAHSGCCILLPARTWLKVGVLLMEGGVWQGRRLVPFDFVRAMSTATPQNPHFGMGLWVAGPYVERRGFLHPSQELGRVLHSAPYLDADLSLFDGNVNQVMYLIPSMRMIILRTGEFPPVELEWDNSYLPNILIADAARQGDVPMPRPPSR